MSKKYIFTIFISIVVVACILFGSKYEQPPKVASERVDPQVKNIVKKINSIDNTISSDKNGKNNTQDSDLETESANGSSTENSSSENTTTGNSSVYKDGTYSGSGSGFKGNVEVKVTVSKGKISQIDIVKNVDDAEYFVKAKKIVDDMIKNQTADVDTVSGATYSSNGIIDAVENALESAVN